MFDGEKLSELLNTDSKTTARLLSTALSNIFPQL